MEDTVIDATAVIGIVDKTAANAVILVRVVGPLVLEAVAIGDKVVQTKLIVTVVTVHLIHVGTHVINALVTAIMGITTATVGHMAIVEVQTVNIPTQLLQVQRQLSTVIPAIAQIIHAKLFVPNAATAVPDGATMAGVTTVDGEARVQPMDATLKIRATSKQLIRKTTVNRKLTTMKML